MGAPEYRRALSGSAWQVGGAGCSSACAVSAFVVALLRSSARDTAQAFASRFFRYVARRRRKPPRTPRKKRESRQSGKAFAFAFGCGGGAKPRGGRCPLDPQENQALFFCCLVVALARAKKRCRRITGGVFLLRASWVIAFLFCCPPLSFRHTFYFSLVRRCYASLIA